MQIHDLNTGTPAATDMLAMDTGSNTYKTTPGNVVPDYTSGDSATATSWTNVTAVSSGLSFSTLIGRFTTMMKNVRFLYGLLGTTDISGIGGGTVTGAISALNSKTTFSIAYANGTATSVSANSTAWLTAPLPTGKTAIALVGYYLNGGALCSVYNMTMDNTGASVAVRNNSASAASVTLTAYYLCIG